MVSAQVLTVAAIRSSAVIVWAFLSTQGVAARTLFKRDAPLATVNIPLTVNKDQRYVVGVNMSSSPEKQSFKFALASNTGYSAVAGTACDSCGGVPSYNASASGSQIPFPGSSNVTIGSASLSGPFIKENCSLHEANGTAWQYPNQTVIVANSSSSFFSDVTSGLIGLGTNANGLSGDFFDTVLGQWLIHNPSRDNFTFGMDLQPPTFTSDDDEGNGGMLHWIVPDSSAYEGSIVWNTANVSPAAANAPTSTQNVSDTSANTGLELPESDWAIELDGWAASISGTAVANASKAQALIEPFFPDIFFPVTQANLFYTAIPSSVKIDSFVNGAQAWTIPCDTALSVAFTFSGQAFPLDQTQLIEKQNNGICIGTIKAWPDSSVSNFMFGSNFISALYLIYVVGRPGSGIPNSIGMATRATKSATKPVGAIAGGTVGGVVFVALLLVGAYTLGRRRRSRSPPSAHDPSSPKMDEKEKFVLNRNNDEASDEGGPQYAINSLSRYGQLNQKHSPSTPLTAQSTQPLLPEAQYPQRPALSVPNTPHSPMDFLAISPGASYRGHAGEASSASVGSHISYNTPALGANMTASRAISPYATVVPNTNERTVTAEPFMLPPASTPSVIHDQKFVPSDSPPQTTQHSQIHHFGDAPVSPQDIDPLSPSTSSAGATVAPFILPPPPPGVMLRSNVKKGSDSSSMPRRVADTPAPPYSAQATGAISPTLVEYSQDSDPDHSLQQSEKA